MMNNLKVYFNLMRVKQYIKNLFIFLPLFFGLKITDVNSCIKVSICFLIFSCITSAIYIFNDIYDIEEDRLHPVKKYRSLASGLISQNKAVILMILFITVGVTSAFFVDKIFLLLLLSYIVMNYLYTIKLKHIPILDVFIIAIGFVMRIFVGGVIINIPISIWMVLVTFFLALFLALAKRRDDIHIFIEEGHKTRKAVDGYNLEFLNIAMAIMATVVIVSYVMYTVAPDVIAKTGTDKLYFTVFFVVLGIMRYLQVSFVEKDSGSPTRVLFKDKFLQLSLVGWIVTFGVLLYF